MTEQILWVVAIAAVVIAAVVGFFVGRRSGGTKHRIAELETEVSRQKQELAGYKREVETHFDKTATLFVSMAGSYKDLFEHLSSGYQRLSADSSRDLFKDRVTTLLLDAAKDGDASGRAALGLKGSEAKAESAPQPARAAAPGHAVPVSGAIAGQGGTGAKAPSSPVGTAATAAPRTESASAAAMTEAEVGGVTEEHGTGPAGEASVAPAAGTIERAAARASAHSAGEAPAGRDAPGGDRDDRGGQAGAASVAKGEAAPTLKPLSGEAKPGAATLGAVGAEGSAPTAPVLASVAGGKRKERVAEAPDAAVKDKPATDPMPREQKKA